MVAVPGGVQRLVRDLEYFRVVVPVDAVILEGTASFDESSLTGESLPQIKKQGEELLSGSVNMDGLITARSLRSVPNGLYEICSVFLARPRSRMTACSKCV